MFLWVHSKYLHHFVPKVVDYFYSDTARFRFGKRSGDVAVQGGLGIIGFPGDLPLFPGSFQRFVQRLSQGFHLFLEHVPDHVAFRIVGNGFQSDMGYPVIHESMADMTAKVREVLDTASDKNSRLIFCSACIF